jgi:hypothetical protein
MLKVELACQEFTRRDGVAGQTSWPLNLTEDQLLTLQRIPNVFTPNTRTADQLDGVAIWTIKSPLLLVTVLMSWMKRQPWAATIVEIFRKEDRQLKRDWTLRMIFVEEPQKEIELTEVYSGVDFVLLPGEVPNREKHRRFLRGQIAAMFGGRKRRPFDYDEDEICLLVSNLGEENQLC